jgi:hypothetical protein
MNKVMLRSHKTLLHRKKSPNQTFSVPIHLAKVYNRQRLLSVFE